MAHVNKLIHTLWNKEDLQKQECPVEKVHIVKGTHEFDASTISGDNLFFFQRNSTNVWIASRQRPASAPKNANESLPIMLIKYSGINGVRKRKNHSRIKNKSQIMKSNIKQQINRRTKHHYLFSQIMKDNKMSFFNKMTNRSEIYSRLNIRRQ